MAFTLVLLPLPIDDIYFMIVASDGRTRPASFKSLGKSLTFAFTFKKFRSSTKTWWKDTKRQMKKSTGKKGHNIPPTKTEPRYNNRMNSAEWNHYELNKRKEAELQRKYADRSSSYNNLSWDAKDQSL